MPSADVHIALLMADAGFARGIPAADLSLAERVLVLRRLDLDPGAWIPPTLADGGAGPLALIVDGVVGRHVGLGDRVATQLLGPGDVFDAWSRPGDDLLPRSVRWSALAPATIAVLDGRFAVAAQRWPELSRTAQARLGAVGERLAVHLAISQLPRVEQRILALLWHLAERFGRVAPDGVVLGLRLTHRMIGELVGAQRPTVSLALTSLLDDGLVSRRDDGALVLDAASRGIFAPAGVPAPLAAPAPAPVPAAATGDLLQRVRVLRGDLAEQRARTIAAVSRSAALRAALHEKGSDGEAA
jgi:CRP/FNR family transcriptional regulator, cyclic AMP receptor protein